VSLFLYLLLFILPCSYRAAFEHIGKGFKACFYVLVKVEIVVAFKREHRQPDGIAQYYITDAAVTESLDVVDNRIYPPPLQFGFNIIQAAVY
jgi:hypothetical protein